LPLCSEKTERFPSASSHPMLTIDVPLTAGIGYAVVGGAVTTGVLVFGSLLLQATVAIKVAVAKKHKNLVLFDAVILDWINLILFVWERFTGHALFTFNPPAKVDELAAFRTEGAKGVVFPLGRLTAGWAFH
jgi:site-specific recombinase